jgi:hypothetical protein
MRGPVVDKYLPKEEGEEMVLQEKMSIEQTTAKGVSKDAPKKESLLDIVTVSTIDYYDGLMGIETSTFDGRLGSVDGSLSSRDPPPCEELHGAFSMESEKGKGFKSLFSKKHNKKEASAQKPRRKTGEWEIPISEDGLMTKSGRPVKFKTNEAGELIFITEAPSSTSIAISEVSSKTSFDKQKKPFRLGSFSRVSSTVSIDQVKKSKVKTPSKMVPTGRFDLTQTSFSDMF